MNWRTLSSKPVIKDRWIDVRADHCVTPAGTEINPYYVFTYPDWVHVVALTPQCNLILVRQYRHAAEQYLLELPGGGAETSDIDLGQTAKRELLEETGFASNSWKSIGSFYPNPATHNNRIHGFLAMDATVEGEQELDAGEEGLAVCIIPFKEVVVGFRR